MSNYNLKNIRDLFNKGFSDEELRRLCHYERVFRSVHEQLAQGMSKTSIVDKLIEYADQKLLMDELLELAKEHNPARYEKHQPYTDSNIVVPPSNPGISTEQARKHLINRLKVRKNRTASYQSITEKSGQILNELLIDELVQNFPDDFLLTRTIEGKKAVKLISKLDSERDSEDDITNLERARQHLVNRLKMRKNRTASYKSIIERSNQLLNESLINKLVNNYPNDFFPTKIRGGEKAVKLIFDE